MVFEKRIINIWQDIGEKYLPEEHKKFVMFLKKCKYHEISITLDPNLINRLIYDLIRTKKIQIIQIMSLKRWKGLFDYLQENSYFLYEINSKNFDILSWGIYKGISIENLNEIIHVFSYSVFDYYIT